VSGITGYVFDIQRFSIHDGPGIRTTVFMSGCPLRCVWCHNPEGMSRGPLLSFVAEKCVGCGYCFRVCPREAHRMADGASHVLDRAACRACGACAKECSGGALELAGREASVEEVLNEVRRDTAFYESSGGGMTLSGGEPLMQVDFTEALLAAAKADGLHCALETCGHVEYEAFRRVLPHVDLFLYDIKDTDPKRHRKHTGADNTRILANLRALHDAGADIMLRLPIVPGINDRKDHFEGVAALMRALPNLRGAEIMPYHRLGESKRGRFGLRLPAMEVQPPSAETVESWKATLSDSGVRVVG